MGQHILQLSFPDCTNEGVFLIKDISIYSGWTSGIVPIPGAVPIPISCANLQITSPGFYSPTLLDVIPGYDLVLNACTLGVVGVNGCTDACPALEDGMYNIRYSVSPNDQVFVEYKVLRIVKALNRYYKLLWKLNLQPNLPDTDTQYQLQQLDIVYNYLISAKVTVENEHQFTDGMNLLRYAVSLMDKMSYSPTRC